jgi:hypothetical protein
MTSGRQLNAWSVRQQQNMLALPPARLAIIFLAFGVHSSTAWSDHDRGHPWHDALSSRFPALFACLTPPELWGKAVSDLPAGYSETLEHPKDLLVSDGCTITVRTDSERSAVYLEVVGGFSGDLRLIFGPLLPDPESL